jgi:hypothetical protein
MAEPLETHEEYKMRIAEEKPSCEVRHGLNAVWDMEHGRACPPDGPLGDRPLPENGRAKRGISPAVFRAVASLAISATAVVPAASSAQEADALVTRHSSLVTPYGVCAHLYGEEYPALERELALMEAAGIGMVRVDFPWEHVERVPGQWNFDRHDAVVAAARKRGIVVLPILDYGHEKYPWPTDDDKPWRNYVRRVVERYAADCPVFEVWNEQNDDNFCGGVGTPARYLPVLRAAYEEAKAVAPNACVAIGGLVNNNPLPWLEEFYKLGGGKYFDILNLHPYSDMRNNPEGLLDKVLEAHREQLRRLGDAGKPIWITEFGWSTAERKTDFVPGKDNGRFQGGADETTAACWEARALGIAFAEGVEAAFHYELRSLERKRFDRESHFGLVRDSLVPKPGFLAWAAFIAMRPAGSVQKDAKWRISGRPGQALYFPQWTLPAERGSRIVKLPGRDAGMVWTTGFEGVRRLRFGGDEIRFFDIFGKEFFPTRGEDGGYDIFVSGSPVYFAGGTLEEPFSSVQ